MTINKAFTGLASLTGGILNAATRESTTTAAEIGPYVNEGAVLFGDDNGSTLTVAASATKNVSFYWYATGSTATRSICQLGNGGTPLFEVYALSGALSARYWNGSAWISLGTSAFAYSTLYRIDFEVTMDNASGSIELFIDGTSVMSFSGDTILDTPTTIDEVTLRSHNSLAADKSIFSAVIIGDEELKDIIMDQCDLTGVGTNSDFTGLFSDVDERGVDDTDFLTTITDTHVSTFACQNLDAAFATGYDVVGVAVNARSAKGPSGIANIKPCVYSNVTLGEGTSKALTVLFADAPHFFTQDPDTAAAWTYAGVNAMEVGVKASST